jgi:hypothetical protein
VRTGQVDVSSNVWQGRPETGDKKTMQYRVNMVQNVYDKFTGNRDFFTLKNYFGKHTPRFKSSPDTYIDLYSKLSSKNRTSHRLLIMLKYSSRATSYLFLNISSPTFLAHTWEMASAVVDG